MALFGTSKETASDSSVAASGPNSSYQYMILAFELYKRKIIQKKQLRQSEIDALGGSTDIQSIKISATQHANELVLGQFELVHLDNLDKLADIKLSLLKYTMETNPENLGGKEVGATSYLEELEAKYEEINELYVAAMEQDKDTSYKINGHVKALLTDYKKLLDYIFPLIIKNLKDNGITVSPEFESLLMRGLKKRRLSQSDLTYSEAIRQMKLGANEIVKWAVCVGADQTSTPIKPVIKATKKTIAETQTQIDKQTTAVSQASESLSKLLETQQQLARKGLDEALNLNGEIVSNLVNKLPRALVTTEMQEPVQIPESSTPHSRAMNKG